MRILVIIAHYFSPEPDARYASVDETRRGVRKAAIEQVIQAWRSEFGTGQAVLSPARRAFEHVPPPADEVSLCILTTGGLHLLEQSFCKTYGVTLVDAKPDYPRHLGFEASKVLADNRNRFDLFVFSEDDLLVRDALFFQKIRWFAETFGVRRLLMPNRYEWNPNGPSLKTFIDGDLPRRVTDKWLSALPDEQFLSARPLGEIVSFRRARNPHSGMCILTREQLAYWMEQPHWADRDTSFVGPLESAATLGVLKTFSVFKSWGRSFSFLGVEHLDDRYSSLKPKTGPEEQLTGPAAPLIRQQRPRLTLA